VWCPARPCRFFSRLPSIPASQKPRTPEGSIEGTEWVAHGTWPQLSAPLDQPDLHASDFSPNLWPNWKKCRYHSKRTSCQSTPPAATIHSDGAHGRAVAYEDWPHEVENYGCHCGHFSAFYMAASINNSWYILIFWPLHVIREFLLEDKLCSALSYSRIFSRI